MTYQKKSTGPFSMTEELRSALQIWGRATEGDEDADDVVTEALNRISQPVAAQQHAQAAKAVEVAGLGSITNEDDGVLTLRFKDEDSASNFMLMHLPTVDCRDMPRTNLVEDNSRVTGNAQAKLIDEQIDALHDVLKLKLENHRMVHMFEVEEDGSHGGAYHLIDRLSIDATDIAADISTGKEEIESIVDAVFKGAEEYVMSIIAKSDHDRACTCTKCLAEFEASQQPAAALDAPAFPPRNASHPAGQQGIFEKFSVRHNDGSDAVGGKHHGCRYFVLDLDHDQHAAAAMRAYAASCRATHPLLAADIKQRFPAPPRDHALCNDGSEPDWAVYAAAEAAPAIQVQESAALDERAAFERDVLKSTNAPLRSTLYPDQYVLTEYQLAWSAWQARSALAAPAPVQPAPVADAVPGDSLSQQMEMPELNADLFDILGRPCFTCIKVAQRLREMGRVIPQRAENEQAETIYLFLSTYLKHGSKWRDEVEAYLKRGTAKPSEEV